MSDHHGTSEGAQAPHVDSIATTESHGGQGGNSTVTFGDKHSGAHTSFHEHDQQQCQTYTTEQYGYAHSRYIKQGATGFVGGGNNVSEQLDVSEFMIGSGSSKPLFRNP